MNGRGSILRVDLTSESITKEPMSSELYRKYLGGEGINARLLWEHFLKVDPKIDPLGADNVLVVGMGPLGATGLGLGSKTKWTFKSPLTGIYGDTSSGGFFGCQLRWGQGYHFDTRQIDTVQATIEDCNAKIATMRSKVAMVQTRIDANQAVGNQPDWSILLAMLARDLGQNVVLKKCRLDSPQEIRSGSNHLPAGLSNAAGQFRLRSRSLAGVSPLIAVDQ